MKRFAAALVAAISLCLMASPAQADDGPLEFCRPDQTTPTPVYIHCLEVSNAYLQVRLDQAEAANAALREQTWTLTAELHEAEALAAKRLLRIISLRAKVQDLRQQRL